MKEKKPGLSLKMGRLKSIETPTEQELLVIEKYEKAKDQSEEQKKFLCELIDLWSGKIFLDWDQEYISKEKAKKYIKEYKGK
jgi:hypothetical protein